MPAKGGPLWLAVRFPDSETFLLLAVTCTTTFIFLSLLVTTYRQSVKPSTFNADKGLADGARSATDSVSKSLAKRAIR